MARTKITDFMGLDKIFGPPKPGDLLNKNLHPTFKKDPPGGVNPFGLSNVDLGKVQDDLRSVDMADLEARVVAKMLRESKGRAERLSSQLGSDISASSGSSLHIPENLKRQISELVDEAVAMHKKKDNAAGPCQSCIHRGVIPCNTCILDHPKEVAKAKTPAVEEKWTFREDTWSGTIILASGREVRIPDPDPEKWELVETRKDFPVNPVRLSVSAINTKLDGREHFYMVHHEQGRCWLKDMMHIVSKDIQNGPFETRFSYLVELRRFREKPPAKGFENPLPTLSVLW